MNDGILINNDFLLDKFKEHLEIPGNNDIIFSAPFGTGKTCFLRDDFTEKMKERYNVIHLYPVNYSIASNEDVFELIKYDILFDLILKFKNQIQNLDDLEIDRGLAIQLYIQNNFKVFDFVQQIFKSTSKVGKSISDVIDILKLEKDKYTTYEKELQENEYDTIRKYIESFKLKQGLLEFDTISGLIREILSNIRCNKENVLIIDDLDRIDPEHIFRIFNVLSAHRDYRTQKNKFGFDKVILVCDIENIQRIYEHRYGREVDFQGYINKFYSKAVYIFDNSRFLKEQISFYLDNLKYHPFERDFKFYALNSNNGDGFYLVVQAFVQIFVSKNLLNLRGLKNIDEIIVKDRSILDRRRVGYYKNIYNYKFLMLIEYLAHFFGSKFKLRLAVNEILNRSLKGDLMSLGIDRHSHISILRNLIEMLISIDTMDEEDEGDFEYEIFDTNYIVKYKKAAYQYDFRCTLGFHDINENLLPIDVLKLLDKGLSIVESRKLLN